MGLRIRASGRMLLQEFKASSDVMFITSRGNTGDALIHAGMRRLLRNTFYRETTVLRRKDGSLTGLGEDVRGHTALVAGSGGWCGPHNRLWPVVLPEIERRFERVIVLPSSVDTSVPNVRKTLSSTKATVFAREFESYRQLRGICRTGLALDTAFFFDFSPYRREGKGTLRAYRTDREASPTRGDPPSGNVDISLSSHTLDGFLWTIARHKTVETDRAHVMIAAAMLGKRVWFRAGSYHKVPAIAEFALQGFPVTRIPDKGAN